MSLSSLTPLPLKGIVNKKIVKNCTNFNPPTYYGVREFGEFIGFKKGHPILV